VRYRTCGQVREEAASVCRLAGTLYEHTVRTSWTGNDWPSQGGGGECVRVLRHRAMPL